MILHLQYKAGNGGQEVSENLMLMIEMSFSLKVKLMWQVKYLTFAHVKNYRDRSILKYEKCLVSVSNSVTWCYICGRKHPLDIAVA